MNRSVLERLISAVGAVVGIVLMADASPLFYAHGYVHDQVSTQSVQQKITFPATGSQGLTSLPAGAVAAPLVGRAA